MREHLHDVEYVVGVDTHKASYTAAVVTQAGAELANVTVPSDAFGHRKLLAFADQTARGRRLWAIEGTGSFGRGLSELWQTLNSPTTPGEEKARNTRKRKEATVPAG